MRHLSVVDFNDSGVSYMQNNNLNFSILKEMTTA